MSKNKIVILGGYGKTGLLITRELLKTTDFPILIAGRDRKKAKVYAKSLDPNRVEGCFADAFNKESLLIIMSQAVLTINCAGPSSFINEKVAESAVEAGCHYVDIGGFRKTTEVLRGWNDKLNSSGLTFCTSAGLLPGLPGVIAAFLEEMMDSVSSLNIYSIFNDELSIVSARDLAFQVIMEDGFFEVMEDFWRRKSFLNSIKRFSFPDPFGKRICAPAKLFEFEKFPVSKSINNFSFHFGVGNYLMDFAVMMLWVISQVKKSKVLIELSARIFKVLSRYAAYHGPKGFAIKGIVYGTLNNKKTTLTIELVHNNTYSATGILAAVAARMILTGEINKRGAFYLNECINPISFLESASKRGLKYTLHYLN